jgi:hypothetical protein
MAKLINIGQRALGQVSSRGPLHPRHSGPAQNLIRTLGSTG